MLDNNGTDGPQIVNPAFDLQWQSLTEGQKLEGEFVVDVFAIWFEPSAPVSVLTQLFLDIHGWAPICRKTTQLRNERTPKRPRLFACYSFETLG